MAGKHAQMSSLLYGEEFQKVGAGVKLQMGFSLWLCHILDSITG